MVVSIIWTPLERFIWGFVNSFTFFGGILYLRLASMKENQNEKKVLRATAIYLFLATIGNSLWYLARFFIPGTFTGNAFIGEFDETGSPTFELVGIGHIIYYLGTIIFSYEVESIKKKSRYLLTILGIVGYILNNTYWVNAIPKNIHTIGGILSMISFTLTYIYLMASSKELQGITFFSLAGMALMTIGSGLHYPEAISTGTYPIEIAYVITMIGTIIFLMPSFVNVEKFLKTNPLIFLLIFMAITIIMELFSIIFIVLTGSILYLLAVIFGFLILVPTIYIYNQSKVEDHPQKSNLMRQGKELNVMNMFSRPSTLTENEVSISKEKQICLVCKNKLGGSIFLCSTCGALYCEKCAKILEDMENACWMCEAPFNETKPVKIEKDIEETFPEVKHKRNK